MSGRARSAGFDIRPLSVLKGALPNPLGNRSGLHIQLWTSRRGGAARTLAASGYRLEVLRGRII